MTKPIRPYSRVYWEARDDAKFCDVWANDHHLATWLRLLVTADAMWPASAMLYHGVNRKSLAVLVGAKLVDLLPTGAYRIHGLDRERTERTESARLAAIIRHTGSPAGMPEEPNRIRSASGPHPVRSAEEVPSRDRAETRRDIAEPRQVTTGNANGFDEPARARARAREMAYQEGRINAEQLADLRAADAVPA